MLFEATFSAFSGYIYGALNPTTTTHLEVYIYRTTDVDPSSFSALLEGANGPLRHLRFEEGPLVPVETVTDVVRSACDANGALSRDAIEVCIGELRHRADLRDDAVIVLMSRTPHDGHWFSIGEGNAHYVHADDWNLFTATSFRLPVTFLLASNVIMRGMYDTLEELIRRAHHEPRGCILDLCMEKQDISLKMRTADACPECMARIRSRVRMGHLDADVVIDCFRLMDKVRRDLMYRRRWRLHDQPGMLTVSGYNQEVDLPGKRVKMSPLQRAIYQFFLLHPEGVRLVDLRDAHHLEVLSRLYRVMAIQGTPREQDETIRNVVLDVDGKLQQHLSRIRRAFREALGREEAKLYYIQGKPAEGYAIALPREHVKWTDRDKRLVACSHPMEM